MSHESTALQSIHAQVNRVLAACPLAADNDTELPTNNTGPKLPSSETGTDLTKGVNRCIEGMKNLVVWETPNSDSRCSSGAGVRTTIPNEFVEQMAQIVQHSGHYSEDIGEHIASDDDTTSDLPYAHDTTQYDLSVVRSTVVSEAVGMHESSTMAHTKACGVSSCDRKTILAENAAIRDDLTKGQNCTMMCHACVRCTACGQRLRPGLLGQSGEVVQVAQEALQAVADVHTSDFLMHSEVYGPFWELSEARFPICHATSHCF